MERSDTSHNTWGGLSPTGYVSVPLQPQASSRGSTENDSLKHTAYTDVRRTSEDFKFIDRRDTKQPNSQRQELILTVWSLEVFLLLFSIGLLVAICIILDRYDQKELPDWGSTINLNALVAVLATVFRASLALVAFEIIAQLKWDWISRCRPMRDVQIFDDASRGIYGCFQLLSVVKFHQPLAIGAIVVAVVSLAIGPFMQQTIQTFQCSRVIETTTKAPTIAYASQIHDNKLSRRSTSIGNTLSIKVRSAMQDSLVNPTTKYSSDAGGLYSCSSGNCIFPTYANGPSDEPISYASLGMCSRCENVRDLVVGPEELKSQFGQGQRISVYRVPIVNTTDPSRMINVTLYLSSSVSNRYLSIRNTGNYSWAEGVVSDEMMNTARWSVSNMTVLAVSQVPCDKLPDGNVTCPNTCTQKQIDNDDCKLDSKAWGEPSDYVAATCILYPCLKYYSANVENGALKEEIIRDTPLRPQLNTSLWSADLSYGASHWLWSAVQEPCMVNGTLYTSSNMSDGAAKLDSDATTEVYTHKKGFLSQNPHEQAGYDTVKAPRECVAAMPNALVDAFYKEGWEMWEDECGVDQRYGETLSCPGNWYLASLLNNRTTSLETISNNINSMAMRLTTEIRLAGSSAYREDNAIVQGEAWESRVCVAVAWEWLALPAALCGICAIILVWTLVRNSYWKDIPVWKGSVLPLLLRQHPGITGMGLKDVNAASVEFDMRLQKGEGKFEMTRRG